MTTDNLSPGQFNADQVIANTQDTIRLAIFHSSTTGKPQHIYQTHYGWQVDAFPPPGGQAHYRAEPTGRVLRVTRGYPLGRDLRGARGDLPHGSEDQSQQSWAGAETGA